MSDFFLDFRDKSDRKNLYASDFFKYYDDIWVKIYDFEEFSLVLARSDDPNIWGPFKSSKEDIFVALAGRIAFENSEWDKINDYDIPGGMACKGIYKIYKSEGLSGIEKLNGNYVIFIFDRQSSSAFLITDRFGMFPCFGNKSKDGPSVFCSHPDLLAKILGFYQEWDLISLSEFLYTGKVSFPFSYYRNVQSLDYGCIYKFDFRKGCLTLPSRKIKYFSLKFQIDDKLKEQDLARELSNAFKKAVNKRISPILGKSAIALSGGLDSRAILCAVEDKRSLCAFTFYDEKNYEYKIAREIARKKNINFIPMKREEDYYGILGEMGVKISGGMGTISENHYLGFRKVIKDLEIKNILSGLYCDYLFKGLLLDKIKNKYLRKEALTEFKHEYYWKHIWFQTQYTKLVNERLDELYPQSKGSSKFDLEKLQIEAQRIFPLSYDAEGLIPQRVMPWYSPIIDNDLLEVYKKIPPQYKINSSIFTQMVKIICDDEIRNIPNSNTGVGIDASYFKALLHQYLKAAKRAINGKLFRKIASEESWPNWEIYKNRSKRIRSIWENNRNKSNEIFAIITGKNIYEKDVREYDAELFFRFLTLKIWIDMHV